MTVVPITKAPVAPVCAVACEAASLAGHLHLDNLCWIYDDNHITIDGETELALTDNAAARFRAYGWHVEELGEVGEHGLGHLPVTIHPRELADRFAVPIEPQPPQPGQQRLGRLGGRAGPVSVLDPQ